MDLKPFTSENDRLKYGIDWADTRMLTNQTTDLRQDSIKVQNNVSTGHLSVGVQTEVTEEENTMGDKM